MPTPPKAVDCTALKAVDPLHSPDMGFREVYRLNCTSLVAPWDADWNNWLASTAADPHTAGLISP